MDGKKELITYEKIFDFVREERRNVQLQQLSESLYSDIIEYLKLKEADNPNSEQLKNAKKLIEDLYERREKKILNLALISSRTRSQLIDTSGLLPEEKVLFKQVMIVLDHYRDEILSKILDKKLPSIAESTITSPDTEENTSPGEIKVKIISRIEKFVGPDLEIIGPFEEGQIVSLQRDIARELMEKMLAERFGQ